jgi:hypothetical protein
MLVLESIARLKKHTILGKFVNVISCYLNFKYLFMLIIAPQIYHSPATSVRTWAEG